MTVVVVTTFLVAPPNSMRLVLVADVTKRFLLALLVFIRMLFLVLLLRVVFLAKEFLVVLAVRY